MRPMWVATTALSNCLIGRADQTATRPPSMERSGVDVVRVILARSTAAAAIFWGEATTRSTATLTIISSKPSPIA
jgi:hypothetical protein